LGVRAAVAVTRGVWPAAASGVAAIVAPGVALAVAPGVAVVVALGVAVVVALGVAVAAVGDALASSLASVGVLVDATGSVGVVDSVESAVMVVGMIALAVGAEVGLAGAPSPMVATAADGVANWLSSFNGGVSRPSRERANNSPSKANRMTAPPAAA
jgi:hypothetical protein